MKINWHSHASNPAFRAQIRAFLRYLVDRHVWSERPARIDVGEAYATVTWPTGHRTELRFDEYPTVWELAQAERLEGGGSIMLNRTEGYPPCLVVVDRNRGNVAVDLTDDECVLVARLLTERTR